MAKNNNKAFTIVELLVAIALLVILVALSSVVFTTTVKAHRKATASIEITRNLRVLTDQLNTDFQGLRKDAPLMIRFDPDFDMLHCFADGDFQSTKQYGKTIVGNIARIYYGHANSTDQIVDPGTEDFETYRVLSRKTHILTADGDIFSGYGQIPSITDSGGLPDYAEFAASFGLTPTPLAAMADADENQLEFNTITLTQWITALNYRDTTGPDYTDNADAFIAECMDDDSRPYINLGDYDTLHLLMAQGVSDFRVQWAYTPEDLNGAVAGFTTGVRWWPSIDPNGDGNPTDSDFGAQGVNADRFGVYFTLPNGTNSTVDLWLSIQNCRAHGREFVDTFYPKALKFTFTLHDSNGMFEDGKTFTHIVYLD